MEFLALSRSKGGEGNGFRLTIGKTRVEKYSQLIEFQCALSCCELRVVNVGGGRDGEGSETNRIKADGFEPRPCVLT